MSIHVYHASETVHYSSDPTVTHGYQIVTSSMTFTITHFESTKDLHRFEAQVFKVCRCDDPHLPAAVLADRHGDEQQSVIGFNLIADILAENNIELETCDVSDRMQEWLDSLDANDLTIETMADILNHAADKTSERDELKSLCGFYLTFGDREITIGAIVEGNVAKSPAYKLDYPFKMSLFDQIVDAVKQESAELLRNLGLLPAASEVTDYSQPARAAGGV
ncbi:hypothetical protein [Roseiconus lacunae]|uniref:hypothetical protein n=1 Tax=Roseiconus lacunae TaxID=2605694 RepID=UPI001E39AA26|nr:hypothetical protein [Roseiconus lacunae]MCD0460401.1 hypothetical protein [Roseiconus lacunae]